MAKGHQKIAVVLAILLVTGVAAAQFTVQRRAQVVVLESHIPDVVVKFYEDSPRTRLNKSFDYLGGLTMDGNSTEFTLPAGAYWLIASRGVEIVERKLIKAEPDGEPIRLTIANRPATGEYKKLEGDWIVQAMEYKGKAEQYFSRQAAFVGNRHGARTRGGSVDGSFFAVDASKSPKEILFFDYISGNLQSWGIYKIDGDELTIAIRGMDQPMPYDVKSGPDIVLFSRLKKAEPGSTTK